MSADQHQADAADAADPSADAAIKGIDPSYVSPLAGSYGVRFAEMQLEMGVSPAAVVEPPAEAEPAPSSIADTALQALTTSMDRVTNAVVELGDGMADLARSIGLVVTERDALRAVLDRLVSVIDVQIDNSDGRLLSLMVSADCRKCTAGTSPRNVACAYHAAKALLKAQS